MILKKGILKDLHNLINVSVPLRGGRELRVKVSAFEGSSVREKFKEEFPNYRDQCLNQVLSVV